MGFADDVLRDVQVATKDLTDPKAKSKRLAAFARAEIAKADARNKAAVGRDVPHTVAVDGRKGAPLASVRPDGVVVAEWSLHTEVLAWIGEALLKASPQLTGRYEASHVLFVDGVEHEPTDPIPDFEFAVFMNTVPYARKIERGLSDQAPDGVYQAVAAVARQRFGNIVKVRFTYRSMTGPKSQADRQPAIVVVPR